MCDYELWSHLLIVLLQRFLFVIWTSAVDWLAWLLSEIAHGVLNCTLNLLFHSLRFFMWIDAALLCDLFHCVNVPHDLAVNLVIF